MSHISPSSEPQQQHERHAIARGTTRSPDRRESPSPEYCQQAVFPQTRPARAISQKPRKRMPFPLEEVFPELLAPRVIGGAPRTPHRLGKCSAPRGSKRISPQATSNEKAPQGSDAASFSDIVAALSHLVSPGQCVPLWIKNAQDGIEAKSPRRGGYFTDMQQLARNALAHDGKCFGIFVGLNPVDEARLPGRARRRLNGKVIQYVTRPKDVHISRRQLLLVDCDPKRDGTIPATADEKNRAHRMATEIGQFLHEKGWPHPMIVDSGNGAHLIYRVDLPAEDGGLVANILKWLAGKYNNPHVEVDTKVSPPSQLVRLPGTMNCKPQSTPERPHRRSRVLQVPKEGLRVVSRDSLEKLICEPRDNSSNAAADPGLIARAQRYLEAMPQAIAGDGSSGRSLAALAAARAIVVDFDFAFDSEPAWQLLQHYNKMRCRPPWRPDEYDDLRRKLAESDKWATEHRVDRGTLLQSNVRSYAPLPGGMFPVAVPDYDWMDREMPALALDNPPIALAYGLRLKAVWNTGRRDAQVPDVLVRAVHWGARWPANWRPKYRRAISSIPRQLLEEATDCDDTCPLMGIALRHGHYSLPYHYPFGLLEQFEGGNGRYDLDSRPERKTYYIRQGRLYYGYWPALVFGPSRKVGLTPPQVKLLVAITREITRIAKQPTGKFNALGHMIYFKPVSDRPDRAEIIKAGKVANSAYTSDKLVCPFLDKASVTLPSAGTTSSIAAVATELGRGWKEAGMFTGSAIYRDSWRTSPC